MAKPNILNIAAFDASVGTTINFTATGNQVYGHRIEIINNETGAVVYSKTQETMKTSHVVQQNSGLVNGVYYACRIKVYDRNNTYSAWSDYSVFSCLSRPVFEFSNISAGGIVRNSEYVVEMNYSQAEGDQINHYYFELYNSSRTLIERSRTMYVSDEMAYELKNLENNKGYFLRAVGISLNGIELDTGMIGFSVNYESPTMWNYVDLANNKDEGNIRVSSNVRLVEGAAENGDVVYIGGTMADLSRGNKVTFSGGYSIENDFNIYISGKNFVNGEEVICIGNDKYDAKVKYIEGIFDSYGECSYFTLTVDYAYNSYQILSNILPRPGNSVVNIRILHVGSLYNVSAEVQ